MITRKQNLSFNNRFNELCQGHGGKKQTNDLLVFLEMRGGKVGE